MSEEQQMASTRNNVTSNTRAWRLGGPLTAAQRKEAKELFIEYLRRDHNVSFASEYAGIARKTAYEWRGKDKAFADQWESAVDRVKDIARSSIYQRGILGWDEPVVSMGQLVYEMVPEIDEKGNQVYEKGRPKMRRGNPITLHKWSDSLAALYAKANLPEYKEKQTIDFNLQMKEQAEQAKNELLNDLAASMIDTNDEAQDQAH